MRFGNCVVAGLVGCLAGSVCAADRSAAIREALGAIPETVARMPTNGVDGARLWNYTPRLERLMPLLKPIGNLPHKRSVDVKASALGIGFETLDRDTFDPKKTFRHLAESGVKRARCQTGWMKCEKTVGPVFRTHQRARGPSEARLRDASEPRVALRRALACARPVRELRPSARPRVRVCA